MEAKTEGPRGGNLENPNQCPERRRSEFKGSEVKLHRFERDDTASAGLKNEKAWHRMAAYMLLAGRTNSEIALGAGVTPGEVSILRAQRWFQELLAVLSNEEGGEVLGVIKGEALRSVETIVDIRDDPYVKPPTRLAAATTLLEHASGKPVQKVVTARSHNFNLSPHDEMEQLQKELEAIRNREG